MKIDLREDVTLQIGNQAPRVFKKGTLEVGKDCTTEEAQQLRALGFARERATKADVKAAAKEE